MNAAELDMVAQERDIYRAALVSIADANSGRWGWIAHRALRDGRKILEQAEKDGGEAA